MDGPGVLDRPCAAANGRGCSEPLWVCAMGNPIGAAPVLAVALAAGLATGFAARALNASAADLVPRHLREGRQLLDDPGDARSWLEERGIAIDGFWNGQLGLLLRDGIDGAVRQSGSADLIMRADLARLGVPFGGQLLGHLKGNYGRNVNGLAAALGEPIDDADGDAFYVDQLWYEQLFADGLLRVRLGYQDQQVAFDRNPYANNEDKQFLNTFLDNDPIVPLEIGIAALVVVAPTPWLELAAAAADADVPPGSLGIDSAFDDFASLTGLFEATLHGALGSELPGALRLGFFCDGAARSTFGTSGSDRGHLGAYLSADQRVWTEPGNPFRGIGIFARAGYADGDVYPIEAYWSLGAEFAGTVPGRQRDALGIAIYQTLPSARYRDEIDLAFDSEIGIESYYRIQLAPWLALSPDAQWIHNPGRVPGAPDAVVLTLRVRVEL